MEDGANHSVNETTPTTTAGDAPGGDIRTQRLADYMAAAVATDDPFAANLGAVNGDLMLIEYRMRQALDDLLKEPPGSLEDLQAAMPGIDGYLRVVKQIDRFSQLALKLAPARE